MRIDASGNVGIGTSAPDTKLHVLKATAGTITNYGDNALVVENSTDVGISLLTPNANAGHLMFGSPANEYHSYIRGGYGANTTSTLKFYTDNINTMTHKAGNVGIGTDAPSEKLHVSGNILATGNITAYSDRNLKENIEPILNAVEKVQQLNGVTYNRNDLEDTTKRYAGIIAQDLQAVLPEAVEGDSILRVDYNATIGLLIEAIKEQQVQIDKLKAKLKEVTK